jgi:hypothetical protein
MSMVVKNAELHVERGNFNLILFFRYRNEKYYTPTCIHPPERCRTQYMKVVKTVETVRVVMKVGIFALTSLLVLTGVLPTNGGDVGIGIF